MAIRKSETFVTENYSSDMFYQNFKESAESVGAQVCKVKGPKDVTQKISDIIKEVGASSVIAAPHNLEEKYNLKSIECQVHYDKLIENKDSDIGISEADFGVVETGSIGIDCLDVNVRLVTAVPAVHIAILPVENIIDKFIDSFKLVTKSNQGQKSYFNYISGPSRTADIERVLTIGVHGPEHLFIIVVE